MISAIGTVLFWMTAAAGAFFVLFFGACMLAAICGSIASLGRALTAHFPEHQQTMRETMGEEQYLLWANRTGPYRDT